MVNSSWLMMISCPASLSLSLLVASPMCCCVYIPNGFAFREEKGRNRIIGVWNWAVG